MAKLTIHDNDGHVDDLLSSLLLWLAPEIDLQAITISNGDCYADQSFEALLKMATYLDLEGAEIAYSDDTMPNPFPDNWRRESFIINEIPLFSEIALKKIYQHGRSRKPEQLISDCLTHSQRPVRIVATGPLSHIAKVLSHNPKLKDKVEELIIMGGALSAPGNVELEQCEGTQEWNLYADPLASKAVFDSGIPIKLITLDVTNQLPVTKDFLEKLEKQSSSSKASLLAMKLWSLVKGFEYYFWDTVTAACAIEPGLLSFKEMRIDILTQGRNQGKTSPVMFGGRKIKTATNIHKEAFEELLLSILRIK